MDSGIRFADNHHAVARYHYGCCFVNTYADKMRRNFDQLRKVSLPVADKYVLINSRISQKPQALRMVAD